VSTPCSSSLHAYLLVACFALPACLPACLPAGVVVGLSNRQKRLKERDSKQLTQRWLRERSFSYHGESSAAPLATRSQQQRRW